MRLTQLDGLRGLAVLLVVAGHVAESVVPYGGVVGVTTFFVLSGFVITRGLLDEVDVAGRIDLRRFWARRVARLLPAFGLLVVVVPVLVVVLDDPSRAVIGWQVLGAVTYTADYVRAVGGDLGVLGHTWSLAVEEQFYAVWPLVLIGLVALARRRPRFSAVLLVAVVAAAVCWRVVATVVAPYDWLAYSFDTSVAALLLGCAGAVAVRVGIVPAVAGVRGIVLGTAGVLLLGLSTVCTLPIALGPVDGITRWVGTTAVALAALVVLSAARGAVPVLDLAPLRWLGTVSYGLYLWHFALLQLRPGGESITGPARLAVIALALVAATLSWYLVERPVIRAVRRRGQPGRAADDDGPGHDGPAHDGSAHDGPGHDGPAHDGPAHDGPGRSEVSAVPAR
ncbi:acyltransferase [Curtobacterium sp. MCPF17_002]|uniref:acyltransferase family protein n=1 Tax=Curtobacterium sp. MCPF17_002 TaxID=2175645 RepID=UPI000DA82D64|nr:acyltransferase [Curtobacterium sp. MCPF17_002]WIB78032.1 acyltransferase [Curtobacterium sp. MCPF17_002]